jgi:hypothetical protein
VLDKHAAKALDDKIREVSGKLATDAADLLNLLKRAKAGQIHVALGFSSWPAYVIDAVQFATTDRADRRMLSVLMYREGMSQRAIGASLGVDQKTVSNDLRSGEENSSAVTAGLDGKTYPREQRKPIPERQRPVTETIPEAVVKEAVVKLTKAVDRLDLISDDARCARNRAKLMTLCGSDLQRAIKRLQAVADKLGVDATVVGS